MAKMLFKATFTLCRWRWYSCKTNIKLVEKFNDLLESNEARHRKHPGIIQKNVVGLPERILRSMEIVLEEIHHKTVLYKECITFRNQLNGRHVPVEEEDSADQLKTIQFNLIKKKINQLSDQEIEALQKKLYPKALKILKQQSNMWKAIRYDEHKSLLYMLGRSLQDYAALHTIFNEIKVRDENFQPETVFDFGSGVGTTMWAVKEHWPFKLKEFMNVDISVDINKLSDKIIKHAYPKFNGIFYREYMPMSLRANHDMVVSAYSLIELPNTQTRLDTVMKLWQKTKHYLVIVEHGSNAGFNLVCEARDFILKLANTKKMLKNSSSGCHVFAPCPHDSVCPRFAADNTPCNFEVSYSSLPFMGTTETNKERYSYVVLKKGVRSEADGKWPRLVRPTLKRGKHAFCRMCNSSGNLEEIIFTRSKHGRNMYRCARVSKWGDRLPIETITESDATSETESARKDVGESESEINKEDSDDESEEEREDEIDKKDTDGESKKEL